MLLLLLKLVSLYLSYMNNLLWNIILLQKHYRRYELYITSLPLLSMYNTILTCSAQLLFQILQEIYEHSLSYCELFSLLLYHQTPLLLLISASVSKFIKAYKCCIAGHLFTLYSSYIINNGRSSTITNKNFWIQLVHSLRVWILVALCMVNIYTHSFTKVRQFISSDLSSHFCFC